MDVVVNAAPMQANAVLLEPMVPSRTAVILLGPRCYTTLTPTMRAGCTSRTAIPNGAPIT